MDWSHQYRIRLQYVDHYCSIYSASWLTHRCLEQYPQVRLLNRSWPTYVHSVVAPEQWTLGSSFHSYWWLRGHKWRCMGHIRTHFSPNNKYEYTHPVFCRFWCSSGWKLEAINLVLWIWRGILQLNPVAALLSTQLNRVQFMHHRKILILIQCNFHTFAQLQPWQATSADVYARIQPEVVAKVKYIRSCNSFLSVTTPKEGEYSPLLSPKQQYDVNPQLIHMSYVGILPPIASKFDAKMNGRR